MSRPRNCSGDMYPGVPTAPPSTVSRSIVSAFGKSCGANFASPKSSTFSCPRGVTMMFCGLMSRWMMPAAWASSSACAAWMPTSTTSAGEQRVLPDPLGQTLAVDVLHDDEDAVVFFADFVDGADVGMVQRRGGPGLVDQPLPGRSLAHGTLGQHLDRHLAPERGVFGQEDLTHPARRPVFG